MWRGVAPPHARAMTLTPTRLPAPAPASRRREWLVPAGLLLLALVPAAAGSVRLAELAGDPAVTPENARFVDAPVPVVVHIVAVTVYAVLGAFQFVPGLRRRRNAWHRAAGTVLVPAGVATALTGLWMTTFYDLPDKDTALVNGARYVVGSVMLVGLVLAVRALLRRDYPTHGAWMTRAYALAMGAGTQAVLLGPLAIAAAASGVAADDPTLVGASSVLMVLAWVINAAVAERAIRRRTPRAGGGLHRPGPGPAGDD